MGKLHSYDIKAYTINYKEMKQIDVDVGDVLCCLQRVMLCKTVKLENGKMA